MTSLAEDLKPPYYAAVLNETNDDMVEESHLAPTDEMVSLATRQPGFLGLETGRDKRGERVTISYWRDLDAIEGWKATGESIIEHGYGITLADACDIWITHIPDAHRARGHLEIMGFEPREPAIKGAAAFLLAAFGSLTGLFS